MINSLVEQVLDSAVSAGLDGLTIQGTGSTGTELAVHDSSASATIGAVDAGSAPAAPVGGLQAPPPVPSSVAYDQHGESPPPSSTSPSLSGWQQGSSNSDGSTDRASASASPSTCQGNRIESTVVPVAVRDGGDQKVSADTIPGDSAHGSDEKGQGPAPTPCRYWDYIVQYDSVTFTDARNAMLDQVFDLATHETGAAFLALKSTSRKYLAAALRNVPDDFDPKALQHACASKEIWGKTSRSRYRTPFSMFVAATDLVKSEQLAVALPCDTKGFLDLWMSPGQASRRKQTVEKWFWRLHKVAVEDSRNGTNIPRDTARCRPRTFSEWYLTFIVRTRTVEEGLSPVLKHRLLQHVLLLVHRGEWGELTAMRDATWGNMEWQLKVHRPDDLSDPDVCAWCVWNQIELMFAKYKVTAGLQPVGSSGDGTVATGQTHWRKVCWRRESYRFNKSWNPGTYEGYVNSRGVPHGAGSLSEGPPPPANHHVGVSCDGCGMFPIVGARHRRLGKNFDYCFACYEKYVSVNGVAGATPDDFCTILESRHAQHSRQQASRSYVGQWSNGLPSGYGTLRFHGKKYEGNFLSGKQHGFGIETRPDGDIYRGEWVKGRREGLGVRFWSDKQRYGGEWKSGKMHGRGVFLWPSKLQYSGSWQQHKRSGHGCETHRDDNIATYVGQWNAGKRHGLGSRTRSDGRVWTGWFSEGKKDKTASVDDESPEMQDVKQVALDENALAQNADATAETIATDQSASLYFQKLVVAASAEDLKTVFVEMAGLMGTNSWTLDVAVLLTQGKAKKKACPDIWTKDVAKHFGAFLKMAKRQATAK